MSGGQLGAFKAKARSALRRYLSSMTTTSSYGNQRSRVSFDRVDRPDSALGDRAFVLSQGVDLDAKDLQSVTWVYDMARDTVIWSTPIEEFFGFEVGVLGFSVLHNDPGSLDSTDPYSAATSLADTVPAQAQYGTGATAAAALLAPILAPIRVGTPVANYDLHTVVMCPDGVAHRVVVRASQMTIADGSDQGDQGDQGDHGDTGDVSWRCDPNRRRPTRRPLRERNRTVALPVGPLRPVRGSTAASPSAVAASAARTRCFAHPPDTVVDGRVRHSRLQHVVPVGPPSVA